MRALAQHARVAFDVLGTIDSASQVFTPLVLVPGPGRLSPRSGGTIVRVQPGHFTPYR
jgi:hypothetical protein